MRRERLNDYSRLVADHLFGQWPEWEEFAKAIDYYPDDPELEPGTLVVKIKPPNPGIKERLEENSFASFSLVQSNVGPTSLIGLQPLPVTMHL